MATVHRCGRQHCELIKIIKKNWQRKGKDRLVLVQEGMIATEQRSTRSLKQTNEIGPYPDSMILSENLKER